MTTYIRTAALLFAAALALQGCKGADGKDGAAGASATACTVTDNGDGTATFTCGGVDYDVTLPPGEPGTPGTPGTPGAPGTSCSMVDNLDGTGTITCGTSTYTVGTPKQTVENCAGCHQRSIAARHAGVNRVVVAGESVADAAVTDDLAITFNVKVDGLNRNDFTRLTTVRSWVFSGATGTGLRTTYDATRNPAVFATFTVTARGNGNYTVTLPGFGSTGASAAAAGTSFLVNLNTGNSQPAATFTVTLGGVQVGVAVSDGACMACHGENVFFGKDWATGLPLGHLGSYNPEGVESCIVCHDRDGEVDDRLGDATTANGTQFMGLVHGIHNSHNMADGTYTFNGGTSFSIGFPGYMVNCSTCHQSPAELAAVAGAPVSYPLCISCHDGWDGFGVADTGTPGTPAFVFGTQDHAAFDATTSCGAASCHDGVTAAPATLSEAHNGLKTERNGLIWDGADVSVLEGAKFALAITGVVRSGTNYLVSWTATYDGNAVSPCNTDFNAGPVFLDVAANAATGKSASNMQFIKAYGQGDDWVNAGRTGTVSPGQPATSFTLTVAGIPASGSSSAVAPNTTCAADPLVAVTTTPVDTFVAAGTRGTMALQGKPQLRFAAAALTSGEFIQARAKSPVYPFFVPAADGAATASVARRAIVDTAKCLDCHKGTLYQHGGNRVDSVDLCVTCHNPAANEKNVRVGFGVDASEAYDGKPGETYDMRTMIHSIHAAGENGRGYVIYRTRGIYFFGNAASYADLLANRNWPTTGVTCRNSEGATVTYSEVYGSVAGATEKVPQVAGDGSCDLTTGPAATKAWQVHNVLLVEYPRPLSDCTACHTAGSEQAFPDPTRAVAVTVDAGAAPFGNQLNDVLIGPAAQSCFTCHQSGDALTQWGLRNHAYTNGWEPTVFVNGRQTLIDAVNLP